MVVVTVGTTLVVAVVVVDEEACVWDEETGVSFGAMDKLMVFERVPSKPPFVYPGRRWMVSG